MRKKKWIPKLLDGFYYVTPYGDVQLATYLEWGTDIKLINVGNCFKTKKQAEQRAKRIRKIFK